MTSSATAVSVGPRPLAALHAQELPQKDNLCGCFWGALVLRAAGVPDVDQDIVASEAGTLLPDGDPRTSVPPGETPRKDYRLDLPLAGDPAASGTSAGGLARAIERLSEGRLAVVPVAGPWNAESLVGLVELVADSSPETTLVANVCTGALWGSHARPSALLGVLDGERVEGPPADWDVGHYVNVHGVVRGRVGALVVVRDTYRSLGVDGHHLQPAAAFGASLVRADGPEGGILCIAPAREAERVRNRLTGEGFDLRLWDNGTPD